MKILYLLTGAMALVSGAASAQNLGEDRAWQFKTPEQRSVDASIAQLMELKKAGAFEGNGGFGSVGGGAGGLLGATASTTNNFFQFVDQSQTTNNCSSSGTVGAPITCGGHGGNDVSGISQVSSGNTNSSSNDISGNTVTSSGNTTTNTQNNGQH